VPPVSTRLPHASAKNEYETEHEHEHEHDSEYETEHEHEHDSEYETEHEHEHEILKANRARLSPAARLGRQNRLHQRCRRLAQAREPMLRTPLDLARGAVR
jgi:ABC-type Zn2+ transport system substrate-binding protein/surface adhesin